MSNYRNIDPGRYTAVFHALSNPHRLQIFSILSGCCAPGTQCSTGEMLTCCVGDLNEQLDIAASTLSHHLRELNRAGLVDLQRAGKRVLCSVNSDMLEEIRHLFDQNRTPNPQI